MSKKFAVAKEELRDRLKEQLSFLVRSAAVYDGGDEAEARRLAVHLRILFHEHGQSRALLSQLGLRDTIYFLDSCAPLDAQNLTTDHPMVLMRIGENSKFASILGV